MSTVALFAWTRGSMLHLSNVDRTGVASGLTRCGLPVTEKAEPGDADLYVVCSKCARKGIR